MEVPVVGLGSPHGERCHLGFTPGIDAAERQAALRIALLQSGQTAYAAKLRLGSRLEPCFIYLKHGSALPYTVLKTINRFVKADRLDPDLRAAQAFSE
jgi:hypothetical protein